VTWEGSVLRSVLYSLLNSFFYFFLIAMGSVSNVPSSFLVLKSDFMVRLGPRSFTLDQNSFGLVLLAISILSLLSALAFLSFLLIFWLNIFLFPVNSSLSCVCSCLFPLHLRKDFSAVLTSFHSFSRFSSQKLFRVFWCFDGVLFDVPRLVWRNSQILLVVFV